ncbi:MAG: DinB family protein [Chloroflexi bacterium]|nr:DinB family protein [Chloroflexota bacterium]
MPRELQEFLAAATEKAAKDLQTAVTRLPAEKRSWSPAPTSRSALDQAAECAILGPGMIEIIAERKWPNFDFAQYQQEREALAQHWEEIRRRLDEGIPRVMAAIRSVPDEDLGVTVEMPWGVMTLAQIMSYPYWNMSYHEGQINYIASILGCLE